MAGCADCDCVRVTRPDLRLRPPEPAPLPEAIPSRGWRPMCRSSARAAALTKELRPLAGRWAEDVRRLWAQ